MADAAIFDDRAVQAALSRLNGEARVSLARSMGVAGGQVFRDTAKALCPVGGDMGVSDRLAGESNRPGLLKSSIYLAFKDTLSSEDLVKYSVSWNSRKAPHGHLVEFGHWQPYRVYIGTDGEYYTDKSTKLSSPKWVPAKPFLRPTIEARGNDALQAMLDRGRVRLPQLLSGAADDVGE